MQRVVLVGTPTANDQLREWQEQEELLYINGCVRFDADAEPAIAAPVMDRIVLPPKPQMHNKKPQHHQKYNPRVIKRGRR